MEFNVLSIAHPKRVLKLDASIVIRKCEVVNI